MTDPSFKVNYKHLRIADNCDAHAARMTKLRAKMLAEVIEEVRRRMCQYGPDAERCDCKYTVGFEQQGARLFHGEQSACPELREVKYFLRRWASGRLG